jgi:peptidoglycan-associated lipoprotein
MRLKILGLVAALTLVAACSSSKTPDTPTASGGGQGDVTPQTQTMSAWDELKNQVGDRVHFDFDKSEIRPEDQQILERQAAFAKKYPQLTFTIAGHCDDRGTREYNLALGERRATAAKNALVALGVDAGRLKTISYGKENPDPAGDDEAAWAENRRAVLMIAGGPSS